jgi:YD repeat-containing protein
VGRRVQMTIDGDPVLTYGYNAGGWLETVSRNAVPVASYTYDVLNRLVGVTKGGSTTSYMYNGDGVLLAQVQGGAETHSL